MPDNVYFMESFCYSMEADLLDNFIEILDNQVTRQIKLSILSDAAVLPSFNNNSILFFIKANINEARICLIFCYFIFYAVGV